MELYEKLSIPKILVNEENHLLIKGENLEYQSEETLKNVLEAIEKLLSKVKEYESRIKTVRRDSDEIEYNKMDISSSNSVAKRYKIQCKNELISKIKRILYVLYVYYVIEKKIYNLYTLSVIG